MSHNIAPFLPSGPILLLQLTYELHSMNTEVLIRQETSNHLLLGPLNQSLVLRQKDMTWRKYKKYRVMLHNFNMDQDITVIESEYDLQHFLENGYNVINYTETFDYSFPGGMFKNLIFSKNCLLSKWRYRSLVHLQY